MPLAMFAITTAIVFCAADFVVIPLVMQPLFKAAQREELDHHAGLDAGAGDGRW